MAITFLTQVLFLRIQMIVYGAKRASCGRSAIPPTPSAALPVMLSYPVHYSANFIRKVISSIYVRCSASGPWGEILEEELSVFYNYIEAL